MKFVIIKDMSAGNESVGEMWQETYVFEETATLKDVYDAVIDDSYSYSHKRITITVPHNPKEE